MKLSIEEKAKAYDEIMDRAKKELDACGSQDCDAARQIFRLIPELAESKDERIRKLIIKHFKEIANSNEQSWISLDIQYILAWLEKQGEQKPLGFNIGDEITVNGQICKVVAIEQKSAEWSEEDKEMIENIRTIIEKYAFSQSAVDVNGDLCEKEYIDADNWLKNLKDRCVSKSKQEVSSDISIVIEDLRELLCNAGQSPDWVFNLRRDIDILNSLKHLNRWKPSDEQLHGLDVAITTLRCQHNAVIKGLDSLYMDLKKLKD